ncbi:MAG: HAMP domain-containing protein [Acidimicrobiales bacterium]
MTWIAVGQAFHPVEAIRARVAHVSSKDLHQPVPVPPAQDEIGRLAATMDAMLDRLEAAADKQPRFVADASNELQSPLAAARVDLEVALAHPDATDWPDAARALRQETRHQPQFSELRPRAPQPPDQATPTRLDTRPAPVRAHIPPGRRPFSAPIRGVAVVVAVRRVGWWCGFGRGGR